MNEKQIFYKVLSSRDPQNFESLVNKWLQEDYELFGEPCLVKTDSGVTLLVQVVVKNAVYTTKR